MKLEEIYPKLTVEEKGRIYRAFPPYNVFFVVKDYSGNVIDWDADYLGFTILSYIMTHSGVPSGSHVGWERICPYVVLPGKDFVALPEITSHRIFIFEKGPHFKEEPIVYKVQRKAHELLKKVGG